MNGLKIKLLNKRSVLCTDCLLITIKVLSDTRKIKTVYENNTKQ